MFRKVEDVRMEGQYDSVINPPVHWLRNLQPYSQQFSPTEITMVQVWPTVAESSLAVQFSGPTAVVRICFAAKSRVSRKNWNRQMSVWASIW